MKIPISEIFFSFQGEGINIGKPAIFVRLYYCNLTCAWCDTKYTWINQKNAKEGKDYFLMNTDEILDALSNFNCKHIVITGGEPLLQQNSLIYLIKRLKEKKYYIEIETNGTIFPKEELIKNVDLFIVSPKLSNSKVKKELRIKQNVLKNFVNLKNAIFKFVICKKKDLFEVISLIKNFNISNERIILMPEAKNSRILKKRSLWLIEECKKRNFRFSTRLHIFLYGNKRGF